MEEKLKASELTLAEDGSLYHIRLHEDELADNVILVGDPNRVKDVSQFFDKIDIKKSNREIVSHTGFYKGKHITALSTGMGVDNLDIVITELDACKNINLKTREIKQKQTSLNLIRLGTTGAMQKDMEINSYICSKYVVGIDGMMWFYKSKNEILEKELQDKFVKHMNWNTLLPTPYSVKASDELIEKIAFDMKQGITITAPGFYGPQGRELRLPLRDKTINDKLPLFSYNNYKVTNYEMETSSLYCLGKNLGHNVLTICDVVANREQGTFAKDYHSAMNNLIQIVLERL
ncbi:MAG: nucleoside phosphorylase [Bacteroidales bacterium]|jgi:uridine phosphorylase|nr:nucleoside phosphorylase [Bacteroidales bacterium]